jgi:hypothetical protein
MLLFHFTPALPFSTCLATCSLHGTGVHSRCQHQTKMTISFLPTTYGRRCWVCQFRLHTLNILITIKYITYYLVLPIKELDNGKTVCNSTWRRIHQLSTVAIFARRWVTDTMGTCFVLLLICHWWWI